MAKEATIKINLDEGNSSKTLKDLKDEIEGVGNSAEDVNKEFKKTDKGLSNLANTLEDFGKKGGTAINMILNGAEPLTGQLGKLKDAMTLLDPESSEFVELAQKASELEKKIKNVDSAVSALSSESKSLDGLIGAGQAIGGAFQASQGAMALFGAESEKVDKAIKNVIAVQGIMNGVMAVRSALDKEAIAGMYLRIAVQKIVTAAQWLWNVAVTANPIGLIILAVTATIAVIIALSIWIYKNIDTLKEWSKYLLYLLGPLGMIALAYIEMKEKEQEVEDQRIKNTEKEKKRHAEKIKQIKRELEAFEDAEQKKQDGFDREIRRLKAEGKSVFSLELQKLESIKAVEEKQLESYNRILEGAIEHYKMQAQINGLSEDEFIAKAKSQGVDLMKLQADYIAGQQKYKDSIFDAESDIIALKRENRESNQKEDEKVSIVKNDLADKDLDKEKKRIEEANKDQEDANQKEIDTYLKFLDDKAKLENDFINSELSPEQQEINAVVEKYATMLELARKYGEDTKILEDAQNTELTDIKQQYAEEARLKKIEELKEQADLIINSASEILNIASTLQELGNKKEIDRIKEKQKAGEQLSQAEKKRLIRDEKQKRAIAVAEIAIDTARAIAGAVASGAAMPFPTNIPAIIAGVGAVLANVASASKILNAPLPSFDSAVGGDVASTLGGNASESAPNINPNQNGSTILNAPPTQVVVLESDITGTQSNVQAIVAQATI
jgi:hypothetical protein